MWEAPTPSPPFFPLPNPNPASEMTYIVSGGALNSTHSPLPPPFFLMSPVPTSSLSLPLEVAPFIAAIRSLGAL